ncbi:MAG TPA: helix-turn-helix domain-containing protein [Streptosporangiaceae bacterium]
MTEMTETPRTRRRAPSMSPDQRREMIIAAALPLIADHGAAVTTSTIARVAGIGEATIFRVFADKEELLDACMAEALSPDHAIRELGCIDLDQPLAERLAQSAEALQAHLVRLGAVAGSLHASGHRRRQAPSRQQTTGTDMSTERGMGREKSLAKVGAAVAELLEPDRHALRRPPNQIAALFLGLLFTQARDRDQPVLATADLVEVFLHGALTAQPS